MHYYIPIFLSAISIFALKSGSLIHYVTGGYCKKRSTGGKKRKKLYLNMAPSADIIVLLANKDSPIVWAQTLLDFCQELSIIIVNKVIWDILACVNDLE